MTVDPDQRPPDTEAKADDTPPTADDVPASDALMRTGAPEPVKADLTKRFVAGLIDGLAAWIVGFVPVVGGLAATVYWLTRDGLDIDFMRHRSIGKSLVGLRPVTLDGQRVDLETSLKRNWPLAISAVGQLLFYIPFLGPLLAIPVFLLAFAVILLEIFLVVTDAEGRRFGDKFADTRVIDVGDGSIM